MGLFDSLFSTPKGAPTLSQTDYTAAANQGAAYNSGLLNQYEQYAPGITDFVKNLYGQTVNPQAIQAQQTQFDIGNQLATQGHTNAQSNFEQYARTMGLQNAAASGAPVGGSFAQSYGTSLGLQQILGNQLQGTSLLNNYAQNQQGLAQGFMQPAQSTLSASQVSPTAFMQGAAANNQIANQNSEINFANSQQHSWFDNLLTSTAQSVVGAPFKFVGNYANGFAGAGGVAGAATSSYLTGGTSGLAGMMGGSQTQPGTQFDSQGIPMAQAASGGGSAGGGMDFSSLFSSFL
jgi:hypothetical protein